LQLEVISKTVLPSAAPSSPPFSRGEKGDNPLLPEGRQSLSQKGDNLLSQKGDNLLSQKGDNPLSLWERVRVRGVEMASCDL